MAYQDHKSSYLPPVFTRLINRSTGGFPRYDGNSDLDSDPREVGNFNLPEREGEVQAYGSPHTGFFGS